MYTICMLISLLWVIISAYVYYCIAKYAKSIQYKVALQNPEIFAPIDTIIGFVVILAKLVILLIGLSVILFMICLSVF